MTVSIPTYPLQSVSGLVDDAAEVFFLDEHTHTGGPPRHVPYRGDYYKIGLSLRGELALKANLETYAIGPNCLMLITPHVLKEWTYFSADHASLAVFFTRAFITRHNTVHADTFDFLENVTRHVLCLSAAEANSLAASLRLLQQKFATPPPYREQVLKNLINSLLYEIMALYDQQHAARLTTQTRSQQLTAGFKRLVNAHGAVERRVAFYAGLLCVTPKHLSASVKETTGKTAGAWIEAAALLEAKALLQNQQLTVAQVADLLRFADPSAFSRFFRRNSGVSPTAYKQAG